MLSWVEAGLGTKKGMDDVGKGFGFGGDVGCRGNVFASRLALPLGDDGGGVVGHGTMASRCIGVGWENRGGSGFVGGRVVVFDIGNWFFVRKPVAIEGSEEIRHGNGAWAWRSAVLVEAGKILEKGSGVFAKGVGSKTIQIKGSDEAVMGQMGKA